LGLAWTTGWFWFPQCTIHADLAATNLVSKMKNDLTINMLVRTTVLKM
jgi:hypothetical protein